MPLNRDRQLQPVRVETKLDWAAMWTHRPNVIPIGASLAAGAIGQFQFEVPYGVIKQQSQSTFSVYDFTSISRNWVRVKRFPYGANDVLFLGRIESDSRQLSAPVAGNPSGSQVFTAYDGVHALQKRHVATSVVDETGSGDINKNGRLLPFNVQPYTGSAFENRSTTKQSDGGFFHYLFGTGGGFWRVRDAIEYLIAEFISDDSGAGPTWSVEIPEGTLIDKVQPFKVNSGMTVFQLLEKVVGRRLGWQWFVIPTATGYILRLATLTSTVVSYGLVTIPANTTSIVVSTSDPDASINIESIQTRMYSRIRVIGQPLIICRSFASDQINFSHKPNSSTVETRSFAGKVEQGPHWTGQHVPNISDDGTLDPAIAGPLPILSRTTLKTIPLFRSHDYNTGSPPNIDDGESFKEFRTPVAYFAHDTYHSATGASLYAMPDEIGLVAMDMNELEIDFQTAEISILVAFPSAQRLQCVYETGSANNAGGEYVIEVPDAGAWWLAKDTKFDADEPATTAGKELRNDKAKLHRVMAGAKARFAAERSKAKVTLKGLHTANLDLGKILTTVADGTDANTIAAPITSVSWTFRDDFVTSIGTGFAI